MLWIIVILFLLRIDFSYPYYSLDDAMNTPLNVTNFKSYFAICAIVKNEPDIREWVRYHYKLGVGKFYIRDNGAHPVTPVLEDFIRRRIVEVEHYRGKGLQLHAYHDCLRKFRTFHHFIAFIDADEFIVTKNSCSIPSILRRYEKYGALTLNWMMFGSSGLLHHPKSVIQSYYNCHQHDHIKSVVNTMYGISHYGNPHQFRYSHNKFAVDTDFLRVDGFANIPRPSLYETMYLNHYHLKSKEDFERNRKRGFADYNEISVKDEEYFKAVDKLCNQNCSFLQIQKTFAKDCPLSLFGTRPISLD